MSKKRKKIAYPCKQNRKKWQFVRTGGSETATVFYEKMVQFWRKSVICRIPSVPKRRTAVPAQCG